MDGSQRYNATPLIQCQAGFLGSALPTSTTQPPGIIREPLVKICTAAVLRKSTNNTVKLYIFNSGILIEILFAGRLQGSLVWYPIENLYCSAGLQPSINDRKRKVIFERLCNIPPHKHYKLKPVFAVVVRETTGKKVLQCHAFSVPNRTIGQKLVEVSAAAYQDKSGWNHPLSDRMFQNARLQYSLDIIKSGKDREEELDNLLEFSEARESEIMKLPTSATASPPAIKPLIKPTAKLAIKPASNAPTPRQPIMTVAANENPILIVEPQQMRAQSMRVRATSMMRALPMSAPSTPMISRNAREAVLSYQGFKTDLMKESSQSIVRVSKSASIAGFPISRSSSATHHLEAPQFVPVPKARSISAKQRSRRSIPATPRSQGGHRILASSDPIAMEAGTAINGYQPIMDWDDHRVDIHMNGDVNGIDSSNKHSPTNGVPLLDYVVDGKQRVSKKKMNSKKVYKSRNGYSSEMLNGHSSSMDSVKSSKSSYSITKLGSGMDGFQQNGHISSHKDADRAL